MIRILIVFLFLIVFGSSYVKGQGLVVTSGGYVVTSSMTVPSVSISGGGVLTIDPTFILTVTGDINFDALTGGSIVLQNGGSIYSSGNLYSGPYNSNTARGIISIASGSVFQISGNVIASNSTAITISGGSFVCQKSIILGSNSGAGAASITATQQASISCSTFSPVVNSNSSLSLSSSTMTVSGSSSFCGMISLNASSLNMSQDLYTSTPCSFIMSNKGRLRVAGSFSNGVPTSVLFPNGSNPIIELNGTGIQNIYNNDPGNNLSLVNLICSGSGSKLLYCNLSISDSLVLGNTQLQIQDDTLVITSTDPGIITRGSGFVSIAYKEQGLFIRNTAQAADYLFPVGGLNASGTLLYRPVLITPYTSAAGSYSVNFETSIPYAHPISQTGSSIKTLNTNYYHKIDRELNSSPAVTISISFTPSTDGSYASVAQWSPSANVWQALSNPTSVTTINGLMFVRIAQYNDFSQDDFILASGGTSTAGSNASYAVLKKQLDGGYYLTVNQILYFKFKEEYTIQPNSILNYIVYARDRSTPATSTQPVYVNYGDNRFQLDASVLISGNVYTLEVLNSKNEKWLLRFKVD